MKPRPIACRSYRGRLGLNHTERVVLPVLSPPLSPRARPSAPLPRVNCDNK